MMDRPAAPTVDGLTQRRYHYFKGESGRSYVHGVFAPAELPYFVNAALVVTANDRGRRINFDVAATGGLPELYFKRQAYKHALQCGANEVHVHFADTADDAQRISDDIAAACFASRRTGALKTASADEMVS